MLPAGPKLQPEVKPSLEACTAARLGRDLVWPQSMLCSWSSSQVPFRGCMEICTGSNRSH